MSVVKYVAVRSDGSLVRYGDQIGYTTYPGHTVPTWFEFAAGLQNDDRDGDAGGSGGQLVIRYERYGQMVTPLRAGSDFGLTVYSVLDPQIADILPQDLEQLGRPGKDDQRTGSSRLLGVRRIPVPWDKLR
jgi:hypothetical protein